MDMHIVPTGPYYTINNEFQCNTLHKPHVICLLAGVYIYTHTHTYIHIYIKYLFICSNSEGPKGAEKLSYRHWQPLGGNEPWLVARGGGCEGPGAGWM